MAEIAAVAQASRLQIADARLDRAVARRWAQALIEGAAALAKDGAEAEATATASVTDGGHARPNAPAAARVYLPGPATAARPPP